MKEIFDSKQPQIVHCESGRSFVYLNECEKKVMESTQPDGELVEVTKYEYDVLKLNPAEQTEAAVLALIKDMKIKDIEAYDSSDAVNSFTFNDVPMWLDKVTRSGLIMRLNAEKSANKEESTLWFGTMNFTVNIDEAIQMIYGLELYASACFDITASHKAEVSALTDMEAVFNYDHTVGYPENPTFPSI